MCYIGRIRLSRPRPATPTSPLDPRPTSPPGTCRGSVGCGPRFPSADLPCSPCWTRWDCPLAGEDSARPPPCHPGSQLAFPGEQPAPAAPTDAVQTLICLQNYALLVKKISLLFSEGCPGHLWFAENFICSHRWGILGDNFSTAGSTRLLLVITNGWWLTRKSDVFKVINHSKRWTCRGNSIRCYLRRFPGRSNQGIAVSRQIRGSRCPPRWQLAAFPQASV